MEPTRPDIVPEDWVLVPCENDCGDMVWVPPDMQDTGATMVCTAACAMDLVKKLPSRNALGL